MKKTLSSLAFTLVLSACGGGGGGTPDTAPPPPPPAPTIGVSATADQILAGSAGVPLTATVSNGSAVSWQLAAGAPGSLSATSGNSVNYTPPPAGVTASTDVVVTASAGGASKQFTITVYPDPGQPGISLLAGGEGRRGFADGKGTAASFTGIQSIAADRAGGYYVYDATAQRLTIRKVSADGDVSTIYSNSAVYNGNGYTYVSRLALASDGALYVLSWLDGGRQLLRISPSGVASVALSGAALDNVLNIQPAGNGAVYLISIKAVQKFSASGDLTTVAGDPSAPPFQPSPQVDGAGAAARFNSITTAGVDAEGNLLLKDDTAYRRMSATGTVTTVALPALAEQTISSIAGGPDGAFYILGRKDGRYSVYKVAPSNETTAVFNDLDPANIGLSALPPFALHGSDGRLLIALTAEIRQVTGSKTQSFAGLQDGSGLAVDGPPSEARFAQPNGIAADRHGNLYVLDHPGTAYFDCLCVFGTRGSTLRKITPSGEVTTLGAAADNGTPNGMAVDRAGNVYFSDIQQFGPRGSTSGSAVYKITPDGRFSVLAGCPPSRDCARGSADGPGTDARFVSARLLGVDADANLYVEDFRGESTVVRKITADGTTTTVTALPSGIGTAPDGSKYKAGHVDPDDWTRGWKVLRTAANGTETVVATGLQGRIWLAPAGPYSVAVISGETILKLVVPH
jgi:sugar lactone lactonase YvrE